MLCFRGVEFRERNRVITKSKISPARKHVEHAWNAVPENASDQRRMHTTYSALRDAVSGGMRFNPNDFSLIEKRIGLVSILGTETRQQIERLYAMACGSDRASANPSAVAAMEKYLKREPFLWAERVRTPERLYVGSEFQWDGVRVKVTSFGNDQSYLSACQYGAYAAWNKSLPDVGDTDHFCGHYRRIEAVSDLGGSMVVRFSGPIPESQEVDTRLIIRRFTITAAELDAARAAFDKRRRGYEKAFADAKTFADLETAGKSASEEGASAFRHFDLDILRDARKAAVERIQAETEQAEYDRTAPERAEEAERDRKEWKQRRAETIAKWLAGEDVYDFFGGPTRVRLKGGFVEASNGNKVTIAAARATLAFVKRHREKGWEANGEAHDVDAFPLRSINADGVRIGCTLICWEEVHRCTELLKAEA